MKCFLRSSWIFLHNHSNFKLFLKRWISYHCLHHHMTIRSKTSETSKTTTSLFIAEILTLRAFPMTNFTYWNDWPMHSQWIHVRSSKVNMQKCGPVTLSTFRRKMSACTQSFDVLSRHSRIIFSWHFFSCCRQIFCLLFWILEDHANFFFKTLKHLSKNFYWNLAAQPRK